VKEIQNSNEETFKNFIATAFKMRCNISKDA